MHKETTQPLIRLLDDDQQVRESLQWLLETVGLEVMAFGHPDDFLACPVSERPGCLLLDVRMPGLSGLEMQQQLKQQQPLLPVILMSGHADVSMAVQAMKEGALDFFEKPFNDQLLLDSIQRGVNLHRQRLAEQQHISQLRLQLDQLTARELQVMKRLAAGMPGKVIAGELGISPKTVDVHRHNLMLKMQLNSLAELIHAALLLDLPLTFTADGLH